jgi:hypothetical protein
MLREFVAQRTPHGLEVMVSFEGPGVRPCFSPIDSPEVAAGVRAMERAFGAEVLFTREGASGPAVALALFLGRGEPRDSYAEHDRAHQKPG